MLILLIAYLGGVLTILSPCVLPVLPFVFARADRPFVRSGLPLLLGMAVSFAAIALLVGGRVFAAMKRSLGAGQWIRRILGVLVLGAVVVIALGLDTRLLTKL